MEKVKVLVAEDLEFSRFHLKKLLEIIKVDFLIVQDGQEAVDALNKEEYDIVFMDVEMPIMTGIEATQIIRTTKKDIPIIAITAHTNQQFKDELLLNGFTGMVSKVLNRELLRQTIEKYTQKTIEKFEAIPCTPKPKKKYQLKFIELYSDIDEQLKTEIIQYFIKFIPEALKEIDVFIENENMSQVKKIAHKLSSQVKYFGIDEASKLLDRIEIEEQIPLQELKKMMFVIKILCSKAIRELKHDFNLTEFNGYLPIFG